MASRGRPRKSAEEHAAKGTYRADRHGPLPTPPDPVEGPPDMPVDLADEVAAKWSRVVPVLAHILRPRHGPMLAELCWWLAEADRLRAAVAAKKPGQKGYCMLLNAMATATSTLLTLSQRFGLTPGDQAKLKILAPAATTGQAAKPLVATRPRTALDDAPPPETGA